MQLRMNAGCRSQEERVRPARGVWRPAKHIFARHPPSRAACCLSIGQRPIVEKAGGVLGETPRTGALEKEHALEGESPSVAELPATSGK